MNESVHQDILQISTSVYLIINNIFCLKNFAFCIYLRAIDFDAFFRWGGGELGNLSAALICRYWIL